MQTDSNHKIKVLIVDDSAVVRQVLQSALSRDRFIRVLGVAADPIFAMEKMRREWPDVIILDVEMPRMDGITFLRQLMKEHPTPVIICSTLTEKGAQTTMDALSAGAVSIVTKPTLGLKDFLTRQSHELIASVKTAARSRVSGLEKSISTRLPAQVGTKAAPTALSKTTDKIVAIGTSTGGTQALEIVLSALPRVSPPIAIVQHMPAMFTAAFADRLNGVCQIEVREARTGDRLLPGLALIAPGGRHLKLVRRGAQYHAEVFDGPLINRHKPSVDVLFKSTAEAAGRNSIGIIMTGMGDDGARGLKWMRTQGAMTMAQDEASCVVYGMPKEAVKMGGASQTGGFEDIVALINAAI